MKEARDVKNPFVRFLLPSIVAVLIFACAVLPTPEPPGIGEKSEKGYALSQSVIAALEQYKADRGSYPETLAELIPDYLPALPFKTEDLDFSYSSTGDSYTLSFHYYGPGMNTCAYTPETKKWDCSGAY